MNIKPIKTDEKLFTMSQATIVVQVYNEFAKDRKGARNFWRQLGYTHECQIHQTDMGWEPGACQTGLTWSTSSGFYIIYFHSLCVVTANSSCLVFRRSFIIQKACSQLNFKAQQGKIFKLNGELTGNWKLPRSGASRLVVSLSTTGQCFQLLSVIYL